MNRNVCMCDVCVCIIYFLFYKHTCRSISLSWSSTWVFWPASSPRACSLTRRYLFTLFWACRSDKICAEFASTKVRCPASSPRAYIHTYNIHTYICISASVFSVGIFPSLGTWNVQYYIIVAIWREHRLCVDR